VHSFRSLRQSARLYADIADTWQTPGTNGLGVKQIIDFWGTNPQFAKLRNGLPQGTVSSIQACHKSCLDYCCEY
jgi:hypothetical protein